MNALRNLRLSAADCFPCMTAPARRSLRLARSGRTVVQALSAARVAVEATPASGWPIALSPLRPVASTG